MAGQDRTREQGVSTQHGNTAQISTPTEGVETLRAMLQEKNIDETRFWNQILPGLQGVIDGQYPTCVLEFKQGQIMLHTSQTSSQPSRS